MKLSRTASIALIGLLIFVATAMSQTPRREGRGRRLAPGEPPPRFQLGSLFPTEIREDLELTKEQQTQIAGLEGEVKAKLGRILTAKQKRRIETPRTPPEDDDHGRPVAQVARDLGVTPKQFREAFKKVHPAGAGEEPTHEQRQRNRKVLSEALGVSPERLDEVMDKYRPGGRGTNGPRPR